MQRRGSGGRTAGSPGTAVLAVVVAAMASTMPLAGLDLLRPAAASHAGLTETPQMATAIDESAAVWTGSAAYVFGGRRNPGSGNIANITKFDPAAGTVEVVATLPAGRRCHAAVWTGNEAYILGGTTDVGDGDQDHIIKFTPPSTVTTVGATLGSNRNCPSAVWSGGSAYLFGGGYDGNGNTHGTVVKFTPPSTVQVLTPTGVASSLRGIATSAVTDGTYAYVFGGDPDANARLDFVTRYHLASNNVPEAFTAKMPSGRYFTSAVWDGSAAHVFGGTGCTGTCGNESLKFVPGGGVSTTTSALFPSGERAFTSAAWAGTKALILGGNAGKGKEIVAYNPNNKAPVAAIAPVAQQECVNGGRSVTLDGSGSSDADGDAVRFSWSAPGITFDDRTIAKPTATFPLGTKTVTLDVNDGFPGVAGHTGSTTRAVTVADTVAPATTASITGTLGNNTWHRSPVDVAFAVTDACGGATTRFRVDGGPEQTGASVRVTGDGAHQVSFQSVDAAGNLEQPAQVASFKIDATPPAASASVVAGPPGDNGWFLGPVDVAIASSDATSGVQDTFFQLDNHPGQRGLSLTVTGDGAHTVKAWAQDLAGNLGTPAALAVRIDTVPPSTSAGLSGTQGLSGWWRSDVAVTLVGTDATSGVAASFHRVDGGAWKEGATFTVSGEGVHTFEYYSRDVAGNVEAPPKSGTVKIDVTPPTLAVTQPRANHLYLGGQEFGSGLMPATIVVGNIEVKADAADALSGMHRVALAVDGVPRGADFSAPYSLPWAAGAESARRHVVAVTAFDVAGNNATQELTVLTVPTTTRGALYSTYDCTNFNPLVCTGFQAGNAGKVCRVVLDEGTCAEFVGP